NARVTSNHPLRSGKGSLYEGGIREPMIVRWPGVVEPGTACHAPVLSTDFYPTILAMAGLEGDPDHNRILDGRSILPLLENPAAPWPARPLYWHYP
ncbi:MAG: sulfatase-like hydrolase/transferase, partial [Akkermansiaceae bacterium]|nr:sulfatase-like hydrolase/transferase [Akkermansiaceae bacterium]